MVVGTIQKVSGLFRCEIVRDLSAFKDQNILLGKLRLSQIGCPDTLVRAGTHGGDDCIAD
jgi:hypothetical protein